MRIKVDEELCTGCNTCYGILHSRETIQDEEKAVGCPPNVPSMPDIAFGEGYFISAECAVTFSVLLERAERSCAERAISFDEATIPVPT